MKNFSEFLNQSSTDSSQKVEHSFHLQEKKGIPKKFQGGKIDDKNFGILLDRIKGKYGPDVQDLNIIANRTDSKSGTVKMDASDYGKIKQGEVQASKEIVDAHKSGTNKTIEPSRSGSKIKTTSSKVTTNVTNRRNIPSTKTFSSKDKVTGPRVGNNISKDIDKKITRSGNKIKTTSDKVTTNVSKPVKFKGFLDRVGTATGIESPITKKLSPNTKVTGLSTKTANKLVTKARVGGLLKGAGRFAGGVFAAKDAYDKARIEKAKGRSKTSQILGGIARGAGGYLGAAAGATLGTIAGGGVGSAVLGTGGAIAGYNVGTKVGDYLYKKGRQLATGKKGEATKTKFKDFMKKIRK